MSSEKSYKGMSDHDLLVTIATKQDDMAEDVKGLKTEDKDLHHRINAAHSRINKTNERIGRIKIAVGSVTAIGLVAGAIASWILI